MHLTSVADEQHPCPVSIFERDTIDTAASWGTAQLSLPQAGLIVVGCAVGGLGLGYLIAAVIGRKVWDAVTG